MKQTVIVTFNDARPIRVFIDVERVDTESYEYVDSQELSIRERDHSERHVINMNTVQRIEIIVEQD